MRRVWLVTLVSCAGAAPTPNRPPFQGVENDVWLAEEVEDVPAGNLLRAFEESARNLGCSTEQLGSNATPNIGGQRRTHHGVSASCTEGVIAVITLAGDRVRLGCAKPMTLQDCEKLLLKIAHTK